MVVSMRDLCGRVADPSRFEDPKRSEHKTQVPFVRQRERRGSSPLEKIVPGDFHKTHTNLLVNINLAISIDENS